MTSMSFNSDTVTSIFNLIEENIDTIKEADYLMMCNAMRFLHDSISNPIQRSESWEPFHLLLDEPHSQEALIEDTPYDSQESVSTPLDTENITDISSEISHLLGLKHSLNYQISILDNEILNYDLERRSSNITNRDRIRVLSELAPSMYSTHGPNGGITRMTTAEITTAIVSLISFNIITSELEFITLSIQSKQNIYEAKFQESRSKANDLNNQLRAAEYRLSLLGHVQDELVAWGI
jgi:hypothetical protein